MNKASLILAILALAANAYTLTELRNGQNKVFDLQMKVACLSSGDAQRVTAVAITDDGVTCMMNGRPWISWGI